MLGLDDLVPKVVDVALCGGYLPLVSLVDIDAPVLGLLHLLREFPLFLQAVEGEGHLPFFDPVETIHHALSGVLHDVDGLLCPRILSLWHLFSSPSVVMMV